MPISNRHTSPNTQTQIRRSPSDYYRISEDNRTKYGTDIGRIGQMLLADRYGERTHFIYELLQNAEDALKRRTASNEQRGVRFDLTSTELRVTHFGVPFDEEDVRGVCGIGDSTKDLTEIGRFGIGFKSVFAFTERPEIHSGPEAFAIESYVRPSAIDPVHRQQDETTIIIPFSDSDDSSKKEVADALSRLGTSTLLFLREVQEINWTVDGDPYGHYLRDEEPEGSNVRRVTIVGEKLNVDNIDHQWLVFSRSVHTKEGAFGGDVEVAWRTEKDQDGNSTILPEKNSRLVVFFPTILETHLGLLLQGPYRTTPSRDNVPERDEWNQTCVRATGLLLIDSLRWLRDNELLGTTALTCLPIDSSILEDSMFHPLLEVTVGALATEKLLPTSCGNYASSNDIRVARTEDLRGLLSADQLATLEGHTRPLHWLDGSISHNKAPGLHNFLVHELEIRELTPEAILRRLTVAFLEAQTDQWVELLYKFLGTQRSLLWLIQSIPVIRLSDGSHVRP